MRQNLQVRVEINFLHSLAYSVDHLIEFGTPICRKALCMCFLKEPELLKCDNCVPTGELEVKLGETLAGKLYWLGRCNIRGALTPQGQIYQTSGNATIPRAQQN